MTIIPNVQQLLWLAAGTVGLSTSIFTGAYFIALIFLDVYNFSQYEF